jgi:hypothetical protein
VGLIHLDREIGLLVVRLFVIGVPLSLVLSIFSVFILNDARYKWYSWISGIELLILALVFWVIYGSQI